MATFLDLLKHNPLLETLTDMTQLAGLRVLPLSRLSKLSLDHIYSSIILSHVALPPFTDISITNTLHCMYELGVIPEDEPSTSTMNLRQTLPSDTTHVQSLRDVRRLKYHFGPRCTSFRFMTSDGHRLVTQEPTLSCMNDLDLLSRMYLATFKEIQHLPFINSLEVLWVDTSLPQSTGTTFPEEGRRNIFEGASSLKRLILRKIGIFPVFQALSSESTSGEPTNLCPHLGVLEIKLCEGVLVDTNYVEDLTEELLEFTKRRYAMGCPLRTIFLPLVLSEDDVIGLQFAQYGVESITQTDFCE